MLKYLKATRLFLGIAKPIRRDCHGMWETEYAVFINKSLLITCHESHTKCGVRAQILLNAPVFIREIVRAQHKCPK